MDNKVEIKLDEFDAAIFDMDGTMINNMPYHKEAWKKVAKKYGIELTDEAFRKRLSGKTNEQTLAILFGRELAPDEVEKYAEEKESLYRELYAANIEPIPGLHDVISTMKKARKKIAVATTAPKGNRDFGFQALGLEGAFSVVLGGEHVTEGKPHPEIYLETAKKLQVDPTRCIVFEDSPPGVMSGKAAEMMVIAVLTTHTKEELKEATYFIKDFTQIKVV